MSIVYFGLGTNLGDKKDNIIKAIDMIDKEIGRVFAQSSFYESEAWGFESKHSFINACIACETVFSPFEVLKKTQQIERKLGRTKKSINRQYHDRIIDIDILLFDDIRINTDELTIPHPLMKEREFVMKPLSEICEI